MSKWGLATVAVMLILPIVLGVAIIYWYGLAGKGAVLAIDAASALVVITAVALGIERMIELGWSAVEMTAGSFWPLSALSKHMTTLTDDVGLATRPYIVNSTAAVAFLQQTGKVINERAVAMHDDLIATQKGLADLKRSVRGSQSAVSFVAAANDRMSLIAAQYETVIRDASSNANTPESRQDLAEAIVTARSKVAERDKNPNATDAELATKASEEVRKWLAQLPADPAERDEAVQSFIDQTEFRRMQRWSTYAKTAMDGAADFLGTFKDNPGRRIISILAGIAIGLVAAGVAGLDLFTAVSNEGVTDPAKQASATVLGILITGLVLGLGSSPTHEVVKFVQESKKQRKSENAPAGSSAADTTGSLSNSLTTEMFAFQPTRAMAMEEPPTRSASQPVVEAPVLMRFR